MVRVSHPLFILGFLQQILRSAQPVVYGTVMRLRARLDDGEIEAVAPFKSRIQFQHVPFKGSDDFLFHRDHDALDQLTANFVLRQRQIDVWLEALRARLAWCEAHGATMRFLIIPEKHVVYEDKLPRRLHISPRRAAMQLMDAAEAPVAERMLYPIEALREASKVKQTYFKTDTHWNAYGAFVTYRALIDSLASEVPLEAVHEDDLVWRERPYVGDLGVRYAHERGEMTAIPDATAAYALVFRNHNFSRGAVHVYENARRDLPTCVLFRDSFSNSLVPYLMRGFSRLVAVSSLSCHYDLLEQEKPDVVVFAVIERFVATFGEGRTIELPEDAARVSFEAFSGTDIRSLASPPPDVPPPALVEPSVAEPRLAEPTSAEPPEPEPATAEPALPEFTLVQSTEPDPAEPPSHEPPSAESPPAVSPSAVSPPPGAPSIGLPTLESSSAEPPLPDVEPASREASPIEHSLPR